MKTYIVYYNLRGANKLATPHYIKVHAENKKTAKFEAKLQIGEIYTVKNVDEL